MHNSDSVCGTVVTQVFTNGSSTKCGFNLQPKVEMNTQLFILYRHEY